jgi:hypothetical protein
MSGGCRSEGVVVRRTVVALLLVVMGCREPFEPAPPVKPPNPRAPEGAAKHKVPDTAVMPPQVNPPQAQSPDNAPFPTLGAASGQPPLDPEMLADAFRLGAMTSSVGQESSIVTGVILVRLGARTPRGVKATAAMTERQDGSSLVMSLVAPAATYRVVITRSPISCELIESAEIEDAMALGTITTRTGERARFEAWVPYEGPMVDLHDLEGRALVLLLDDRVFACGNVAVTNGDPTVTHRP